MVMAPFSVFSEACGLATPLPALEQGRWSPSGPTTALLARLDLSLAREEDAAVVIDTTVLDHDDGYQLTRLGFAGGSLQVPRRPLPVNARARIKIQARDVSIALASDHRSSIVNRLPARITGFGEALHPAQCLVRLELAGTPLLARITRLSRDQLGLTEGMAVVAQIKSVAVLG